MLWPWAPARRPCSGCPGRRGRERCVELRQADRDWEGVDSPEQELGKHYILTWWRHTIAAFGPNRFFLALLRKRPAEWTHALRPYVVILLAVPQKSCFLQEKLGPDARPARMLGVSGNRKGASCFNENKPAESTGTLQFCKQDELGSCATVSSRALLPVRQAFGKLRTLHSWPAQHERQGRVQGCQQSLQLLLANSRSTGTSSK